MLKISDTLILIQIYTKYTNIYSIKNKYIRQTYYYFYKLSQFQEMTTSLGLHVESIDKIIHMGAIEVHPILYNGGIRKLASIEVFHVSFHEHFFYRAYELDLLLIISEGSGILEIDQG
ncbi:hypothetical protein ACJX0J_009361 [Zea mays]